MLVFETWKYCDAHVFGTYCKARWVLHLIWSHWVGWGN